jgi:hypothetical protein
MRSSAALAPAHAAGASSPGAWRPSCSHGRCGGVAASAVCISLSRCQARVSSLRAIAMVESAYLAVWRWPRGWRRSPGDRLAVCAAWFMAHRSHTEPCPGCARAGPSAPSRTRSASGRPSWPACGAAEPGDIADLGHHHQRGELPDAEQRRERLDPRVGLGVLVQLGVEPLGQPAPAECGLERYRGPCGQVRGFPRNDL